MKHSSTLIALTLFALGACSKSDPASETAAEAKDHFMSAQQKVLEQAKEIQDKAEEELEKQKKALEAAGDK